VKGAPLFLVLSAIVLLLGGCAATARTTRVADVANGDFYTNDEIKGLSNEERDRYCATLDAEIVRLREEATVYEARSDSLKAHTDSLRTVNTGLTNQIRDIDPEIRQLRLARRAATSYVVKQGDTLEAIASSFYGDQTRWKEIAEANKDRIGTGTGKGALKPGTVLTIPSK